MKITIGSLIRKELSNPDSEMSRRVRRHKAYVRLLKNDPANHKINLSYHGGFIYNFKWNGVWQEEHIAYSTPTIADLLQLR